MDSKDLFEYGCQLWADNIAPDELQTLLQVKGFESGLDNAAIVRVFDSIRALYPKEVNYGAPMGANKRETAVNRSVLTAETLSKMKIDEPESLLYPWLTMGSLNFVAAPRGIGKTLFAHEVTAAVASGEGFGPWPANKPGSGKISPPRQCLVIDGELTLYKLQQRQRLLIDGRGESRQSALQNISWLTRDSMSKQGEAHVNIADLDDQKIIYKAVKALQPEFILLDNLSTLTNSQHSENTSEWFSGIQNFLFDLRSRGACVVVVHHAGKNGKIRGTSKMEDALDVSIALNANNSVDENFAGAAFELTFTKTRDFSGKDKKPLLARCGIQEVNGEKRIMGWSFEDATAEAKKEALELSRQGMGVVKIAELLGLHRNTVARYLKT